MSYYGQSFNIPSNYSSLMGSGSSYSFSYGSDRVRLVSPSSMGMTSSWGNKQCNPNYLTFFNGELSFGMK